MDDSISPRDSIIATTSDSFMDFDYIDQLLNEGCWLQTTDGSDFLQRSPSTSYAPFDSSSLWPSLEAKDGNPSECLLEKDNKEDKERSPCPEKPSTSQPVGEHPNKTQSSANTNRDLARLPIQAKNLLVESCDISRSWWIGPSASRDPALSVTDRLIRAVQIIKDLNKNSLIQVWLPVNKGGKKFLSTSNLPFSLDWNWPQLGHYRDISEKYEFAAEQDSKENAGLPGRVFMGKVPEWTPDVRFFKKEEYPRVGHAQQYDVRGTFGVPVFDQGSTYCLGVIEVVLTTQKINYSPELESVCKALEAVDLRSSEAVSSTEVKESDGSYQTALPEILKVLKCACETHKLPLAQTWVSCIQQGKAGCRHCDENLLRCISPVASACFISNPQMRDFHEACAEHHLLKGQGVVGNAFKTNKPCFSPDVKSYKKTEYPLSHHAMMFGLCAAVAIRLRSVYSEKIDYVLEFFLPVDCEDPEEQRNLLNSLSIIIQNKCQSLRIVSDKELLEETTVPIVEVISTYNTEEVTAKGKPSSAYNEGRLLNQGSKREKKRGKVEKNISLQLLRQHFSGSLKDAAKNLGVCPTTLKRICRQHGITRWPSRKIKKVGHSLQKIQLIMESVQGASSGSVQVESFYTNFPEFSSSNIDKTNSHLASKSTQALADDFLCLQEAGASKSPSPSCSRSSSSYHSSSSGALPNPDLLRIEGHIEPFDAGEPKSFVKSLDSPAKPNTIGGSSPDRDVFRVKVTYGEEKIRLRLQKDWGFLELKREIMTRFGLNDQTGILLKYLDDESEWVLITCDADLEECIDIYRFSQNRTIKLSVFCNPQRPV